MDAIDLNRLMRPKKVCVCNQVSEEEIRKAVREGAHSLEEIANRTKATTNCGTCSSQVISLLRDELKKLSLQ